MQQELNQLEKLEKQIRDEIKHESDMEEYVILESKNIAEQLYKSKKIDTEIKDTEYRLMYVAKPNANGFSLVLFASNIFKMQTLGQMYKPYVVQAEADNGMSELANLIAIVEALLRQILNVIKPEILPENQ